MSTILSGTKDSNHNTINEKLHLRNGCIVPNLNKRSLCTLLRFPTNSTHRVNEKQLITSNSKDKNALPAPSSGSDTKSTLPSRSPSLLFDSFIFNDIESRRPTKREQKSQFETAFAHQIGQSFTESISQLKRSPSSKILSPNFTSNLLPSFDRKQKVNSETLALLNEHIHQYNRQLTTHTHTRSDDFDRILTHSDFHSIFDQSFSSVGRSSNKTIHEQSKSVIEYPISRFTHKQALHAKFDLEKEYFSNCVQSNIPVHPEVKNLTMEKMKRFRVDEFSRFKEKIRTCPAESMNLTESEECPMKQDSSPICQERDLSIVNRLTPAQNLKLKRLQQKERIFALNSTKKHSSDFEFNKQEMLEAIKPDLFRKFLFKYREMSNNNIGSLISPPSTNDNYLCEFQRSLASELQAKAAARKEAQVVSAAQNALNKGNQSTLIQDVQSLQKLAGNQEKNQIEAIQSRLEATVQKAKEKFSAINSEIELKFFKAIEEKNVVEVIFFVDAHPHLIRSFNHNGETGLQFAIKHSTIEIIVFLLIKGSSLTIPTFNGKTAIQLAKKSENKQIISILNNWMEEITDQENPKKREIAMFLRRNVSHSTISKFNNALRE